MEKGGKSRTFFILLVLNEMLHGGLRRRIHSRRNPADTSHIGGTVQSSVDNRPFS